MSALSPDLDRITVNAAVCGGRPCIRDTRVRVTDFLGMLSAGVDVSEILADYPYLEREDISAALEYARRMTHHRVIAAAE